MQRLDSAIAFVDRAAVAKSRAVLEAELLETFSRLPLTVIEQLGVHEVMHR